MIIYNVTCNVQANIAEQWLAWMRVEHIPEVMDCGLFADYRILKVLTNLPDDDGVNYSIQYYTDSEEKLAQYQTEFGPALQQKTLARFGDKVLAFRTTLQVVG